MTPRPPAIRTKAETALADAFTQSRANLPGGDAVRGQRTRAFDVFHERGLPHRRIEAWHYTDLRNLMREAYPITVGLATAPLSGLRVVIQDGVCTLPTVALPAGLKLTALRDVLAGASDALVHALFPDQGGDDAMVAFNAAMARDGVLIEIAPGAVIETPIELSFISSGDAPHGDISRSLVMVGEGARASILESHAAPAKVQRNSAMIFAVGAGASLAHVFETCAASPELHIATLIADVGQEARFESFAFVSAGEVLRRQAFVRGSGEGAKIALRGINLLKGKQHADTTLVVDHAAPHGESRELFKTILDGEASCVFQGKVVVRPHAQKTDGGMKSQAILLSDDAAMYNKPELEIFADDVVCGHGATVGQLDEDQIFYLMARGLPRVQAEGMIIEGFAREALEFVGDESIRERLGAGLSDWLARRAS